MNTIDKNVINEIVIKNSRFICLLYQTDSIDEINTILDNVKKEYKDATHICYAYAIENAQKYSDDGEPCGTAGAPIMDVIKKNDIINCLAVVVRYFGGIKLGAGGLIRAYSKAVREALKITSLEELVLYNYYDLISNYNDLKLLNTLSNDLCIIKKDFKEEIVYEVKIEKDNDNIKNIFKNTNIKTKKLN